MKRRSFRRVLACLLTVLMCLQLVPLGTLAVFLEDWRTEVPVEEDGLTPYSEQKILGGLPSLRDEPDAAQPLEADGEVITVSAPEAGPSISVWLEGGVPYYQIVNDSETLVEPSKLGLNTSLGDLADGYTMGAVTRTSGDTTWQPVVGEQSSIRDYYNAASIPLTSGGVSFALEVRAYQTGVAFRYVLPESVADYTVDDEHTQFVFPAGTKAALHSGGNQTVPIQRNVESLGDNTYMRPATLQYASGSAMTICEANLDNYGVMALKRDTTTARALKAVYVSYTPGRPAGSPTQGPGMTVSGGSPAATPWRTFVIGKSLIDLPANSTIVINLNEAADEETYKFSEWVEPGSCLRAASGMNNAAIEKIVDQAQEKGIKYVLLDTGWYGPEYDINCDPRLDPALLDPSVPSDAILLNQYLAREGDETFLPGGEGVFNTRGVGFDVYKDLGTPGSIQTNVDIPALCDYANKKGVGIILYVNGVFFPDSSGRNRFTTDDIFAKFEKWGVKGVKPGFVHVRAQKFESYMQQVVESAARHHLVMTVHDEWVTTGLERTFPNLFCTEGILGDEGIGRSSPQVAEDIATLFTRPIQGPTDHTYCWPGKGTKVYALASPLMFRTGMSVLYWYTNPASVPTKDKDKMGFWQDFPGTWDESRYLEGSLYEYATYARHSGDTWYLGSLSAIDRTLEVPLDFLESGKIYKADIYADGSDADATAGWNSSAKGAQTVENNQYLVKSDTVLKRDLGFGFGYAAKFTEATEEDIANLSYYDPALELLAARLESYKKLTAQDYTSDTWAVMAAAISAAQAMVDDPASYTSLQMEEAMANLESAQAGLLTPAALQAALAQTTYLTGYHYTPESWAALQSARQTAEDLLAGGSFSQAELDQARSALTAATEALVSQVSSLRLGESKYLSDMNYASGSWSVTAWNTDMIRKDKNRENKAIALMISGTRTEFPKGMALDAPGDLYYNIEGLGYQVFQSYVGVDATKQTQGDVVFRVYGDGQLLYESAPSGTGSQNAQFVSVPIAGVSLLRLEADMNGSKNGDWATWADAKLLTYVDPEASVNAILVDGKALPEFDRETLEYWYPAPEDGAVPTVTVQCELGAQCEITQAAKTPGAAEISVTRGDGSRVEYTVIFCETVFQAWFSDIPDSRRLENTLHTLSKNTGYGNSALTLVDENGETMTFDKGFGVHATNAKTSTLTYNIDGLGYQRFESYIGINGSGDDRSSVIFRFYLDDETEPRYVSGLMKKETPAQYVSLDIAGAKKLRIVVDPNGDMSADHADLAGAKFLTYKDPFETLASLSVDGVALRFDRRTLEYWCPAPEDGTIPTVTAVAAEGLAAPQITQATAIPGAATVSVTRADGVTVSYRVVFCKSSVTYLSDLNYTADSWTVQVGTKSPINKNKNRAWTNISLMIDGERTYFEKGMGMDAPGELYYDISGLGFDLFQSYVGVDAEKSTQGNIIFRVYGDGQLLYESAPSGTGSQNAQFLSVPVTGVSLLRLESDMAGSKDGDWSDWADAKFLTYENPYVTLKSLSVNGAKLGEFQWDKHTYYAPAPADDSLPTVSAVCEEGVSCAIVQPQHSTGTATVTATRADGSTEEYRIIFCGMERAAYLSDLGGKILSNTLHYGVVKKDVSTKNDAIELTAADGESKLSFTKGVGLHASSSTDSTVVYNIAGMGYQRFESYMGIRYATYAEEIAQGYANPRSKVIFRFYVDDETEPRYESAQMTNRTPAEFVSIDVTGASKLRINVDAVKDQSADHANLGDAKFLTYGPGTIWVNEPQDKTVPYSGAAVSGNEVAPVEPLEGCTVSYAEKTASGYAPWTDSPPTRTQVGTTSYKWRVECDGYTTLESAEDVELTVSPLALTDVIGVELTGTARYDETLTAAVTDLDSLDGPELRYTWYRVEEGQEDTQVDAVAGHPDQYLIKSLGVGKKIKVVVSTDDPNYTGTVTAQTDTVAARTFDVTFNGNGDGVTYDGAAKTLSAPTVTDHDDAGRSLTPTVEYKLEDGDYSTDFPEVKNAGTYTVWCRVSLTGYQAKEVSAQLKINKAKKAVPNATPDYLTEKLDIKDTGVHIFVVKDTDAAPEAGEISNPANERDLTNGLMDIPDGWFGKYVNIYHKGDANHDTSDAQQIPLAARPAAPVEKDDEHTGGVFVVTQATSAVTGGKVEAVDANLDGAILEYSPVGDNNWYLVSDASAKNLAQGKTYEIRVKATDSAPHGEAASFAINTYVKNPQPTPQATVNYQAERLEGLVANGTYKITVTADASNSGNVDHTANKSADEHGYIDLIEERFGGQTIALVDLGIENISVDSAAQTIVIVPRPGAPTGSQITITDASESSQENGSVSGITDDMEYATSSPTSSEWSAWQTGDGNAVTVTGGYSIKVRYKATASAPYGKEYEGVVGAYTPPDTTAPLDFTKKEHQMENKTATQATFTFKNERQDAVFKLYDAATGGSEVDTTSEEAAVTMAVSGTTVTLTFKTAPTEDVTYYISVKEGERTESTRALLTVKAYVLKTTAQLEALTITREDGTPVVISPNFVGSTLTGYTATVPYEVDKIVVTPTVLKDSGAAAEVEDAVDGKVSLNVGENTVTVTVTAESGATADYVVTVTRSKDISAAPAFSAATYTFASVSDNTATFTVTNGADTTTYKVYNAATLGGQVEGITATRSEGVLTLAFTAVPGTSMTYYISATEAGKSESTGRTEVTVNPYVRSSNADLSGITVSEGTLNPGFDKDTLAYTVEVANSVDSVTVTATAEDANASCQVKVGEEVKAGGVVSDLTVGDNVITIKVTAEDNTPKIYTVTVKRAKAAGAVPQAAFDAAAMTLTGVAAGMKYSVDGGESWFDISGDTVDLSEHLPGVTHGIRVKRVETAATLEAVQTITVTQAETPSAADFTAVTPTAPGGSDGHILPPESGKSYQYKKSASADGWAALTGDVNLTPGDYLVRVAPSGTVLASEAVTVTVEDKRVTALGAVTLSSDQAGEETLNTLPASYAHVTITNPQAGQALIFASYKGAALLETAVTTTTTQAAYTFLIPTGATKVKAFLLSATRSLIPLSAAVELPDAH